MDNVEFDDYKRFYKHSVLVRFNWPRTQMDFKVYVRVNVIDASVHYQTFRTFQRAL